MENKISLKQFVISPAAGKRLIGMALAKEPIIQNTLKNGTLAIVAGTTNGYVSEEVLKVVGLKVDYSMRQFFRGIVEPSAQVNTRPPKLNDANDFRGDIIFVKGKLQKDTTIFDIIDDLQAGDVILKGANGLDPIRKRAAILVGDRKAGTIGVIMQAVVGRRVKLILPVGLEKRIYGDIDSLAQKLNSPGAKGPRLLPVPGQVYTEMDAITKLTGATVDIVAGGGVCGAEGSIRVALSGTSDQIVAAETILDPILATEPMFMF